MPDHQERLNHLVDELEPEQRDYLKQAIRDIALRGTRRRDASDVVDVNPRGLAA